MHRRLVQDGPSEQIRVADHEVQADDRPQLVPKTAAGTMPKASIKPAAAADCSSAEVLCQPSGRGLRELARRS